MHMAHHKDKEEASSPEALKLEMKDVVLVKPSKPTPSGILSVSTLDNKTDPLDSLCPIVYAYLSHPDVEDNPADVIKDALSKALVYYYPLAGRLMRDCDGKVRVMMKQESNGDDEFGVPFLEATANCDLSSLHYLDGDDTEIAKELVLHPPTKSLLYHPLLFMVTKFQCGGFTIGLSSSHVLSDGSGASQFFHAIVELASGRNEPSIKPMWERESMDDHMAMALQGGSIPSTIQVLLPSPYAVSPLIMPNTVVKQVCVKVENEMVRRLKVSLIKEGESEVITTFEILAACLWRSRAIALKLSPNGKTVLEFSVGLRGSSNFNLLLGGPLGDGYYGNAVMDVSVVITVRELIEMPLSEIIKLIKETKKHAFTVDCIRNSMIETEEQDVVDYKKQVAASGAVTSVTEWRHLGFMENVDFRGKQVVNMIPAPCNMFAPVYTAIFLPESSSSTKFGGRFRIFTNLPVAAIPKFREEFVATLNKCIHLN